MDTIPAMAWSVSPDGKVEFLNRHWLEYTGLSLAAALAKPNDVVHPDDVPPATAAWRHSLETGAAYELEMRLRAADGKYRWFLVRTEPLRNETGAIVKWYGTSVDVEDRRAAAARAGAAEAVDPLRALSLRELMVLRLVAEGMTSKEIAAHVNLTRSTVDSYRSRIMEKLEARNVVGLVRIAIRNGLVRP
jgi:PAS domain S-box-containing protein